MKTTRFVTAVIVVTVTGFATFPATAGAWTLNANKTDKVCVVDATDNDSGVDAFWTAIQDTVKKRRLDELDEKDPGLKQAILDYDNKKPGASSPGELQNRIAATGATEGLGMLIRTTANDAGVPAEGTPTDRKQWNEDEAYAAAAAIGPDPAAKVGKALDETATRTGNRMDALKAEAFKEKDDEFNTIEFAMRDELTRCADELHGKDPLNPGWIIFGGLVALAIVAMATLALHNARRPVRHGK